MQTPAIATAAVILLGLSVARAQEEKIALDKLPKEVLDAVKAKYPGAELLGAEREKEKGKTVYEVALKHKGHRIEVTLTPEGKIIEIEKEVAVKDFPKAVQEALAAKYAKAKVKKAEEVTKGEKVVYEVLIDNDGALLEVVFDPSGKILMEERQKKAEKKG
jgi:uncharacterized membrane protein YkoI